MRLVVGRIGRAHGVRGDVAVDVRTDDPAARFAPGSRLATDPADAGPLTVSSARTHSGRLLVRFAGVSDRTAAEGLRGVTLWVDSADVPPVDDPDEFHDHELIGLRVRTTAGEEVGEVADVLHNAQDVLVVADPQGAEFLVPFIRDLVPEVDPAAGVLVVDPPPGLLDLGR
ncbi:ribosome maturation factor RimM [Streptomonospora nanhaiensis]|uniref:Ribosome maturation factor RimM n=1 Tax=Streptomonospora nanhaiensis TaxID=1323731 RepID=A0A853BT39_9ACTN|nr:ribosome maturation factor RimM [Streptomonospora nanhaiensis]MBV2362569.1 ribosome maturation factor RimM [Streptomonospora nanhaiensis]MBX9386849.1 ribosome maturation factor RimM [Streptomonospora nanhaiensis]NYI98084.1 16S rRNA processing protein RimM [Streptomonospora nanhaiensis]